MPVLKYQDPNTLEWFPLAAGATGPQGPPGVTGPTGPAGSGGGTLPPESDANRNTYYGLGTPADLKGSDNAAFGINALTANVNGASNMALGPNALASNTSGGLNVGVGNSALYGVTTGAQNVGVGHGAGHSNVATTTQNFQTFLGAGAEQYAPGSGDEATSVGHGAKSHTQAVALGAGAEARGVRSTAIGWGAIAVADNSIMLGGHAPESQVFAHRLTTFAANTWQWKFAYNRDGQFPHDITAIFNDQSAAENRLVFNVWKPGDPAFGPASTAALTLRPTQIDVGVPLMVQGQPIHPWVPLTQAEYDALATKDPTVLYVVTDAAAV